MPAIVKVFGCRPTKMTPRTPGPAYANLQRRKPREGIRQTVRRALSKMVSRVISIRSREFSKNLGFEYVYNFGVVARVLLTGESRFLSSCDFKELRVIKRARFTTLTLAASQHSFCRFSPMGTFETCSDVRSLVAIRGKADVARTTRFGSD